MLTFIHDEVELKKFFDIVLPPLSNTEVYFVSMSARNKQLTEEERRFYDLGRTEMFERKIIREKDWMKFLRTIRKFEMHEGGMTGRSGIPLPSKCLILYFNVNPCDVVQAYKIFQNEMTENVYNLVSGRGSDPAFFKRMDRLMMNAIQKSKGEKHYIDIDLDLNKGRGLSFVQDFLDALKKEGVEYFLVDTKGGFHVLLRKKSIHFNYNVLINEFQKRVEGKDELEVVEINPNRNGMIGLPGTLQADYPTRILWDRSNYQ
jgi:hypothetical protein